MVLGSVLACALGAARLGLKKALAQLATRVQAARRRHDEEEGGVSFSMVWGKVSKRCCPVCPKV
jgi:hypothetical protein